jgi:hypothetical protein
MVDIIGERKKGIFNPNLADKLVFDEAAEETKPAIVSFDSELAIFSNDTPNLEIALSGRKMTGKEWKDYARSLSDENFRIASLLDVYALFKKAYFYRKEPFAHYTGMLNGFHALMKNTIYLDSEYASNFETISGAVSYRAIHNNVPGNHIFHSADMITRWFLDNLNNPFDQNLLRSLFNESDEPTDLARALKFLHHGFKLKSDADVIYERRTIAETSSNMLYVSRTKDDKLFPAPSNVTLLFSDDNIKECVALRKRVK